jgi:hypothetical protein
VALIPELFSGGGRLPGGALYDAPLEEPPATNPANPGDSDRTADTTRPHSSGTERLKNPAGD